MVATCHHKQVVMCSDSIPYHKANLSLTYSSNKVGKTMLRSRHSFVSTPWVGLLLLCLTSVSAWSGVSTRRYWFAQTATIATAAVAIVPPAQAASSTAALLDDLKISKEKLQAIPSLLEEKEWNKVRSILKLPPVNKLWNLGDVSRHSAILLFYADLRAR
jgi:hypothetical protein